MTNQIEELTRAAIAAVLPPPALLASEWADEFRFLSSEASSETGRWRTNRFEFSRGMMDAANDPDIHTVCIMGSAQIAKTEVVNNVVGYHADKDPCPILVVHPTLREASDWLEDRFMPMVTNCPSLAAKVGESKSRDKSNTKTKKTFPGGHITVAGGNSPAGLAGRPIRIIVVDDADRVAAEAGKEGDAVALALKRTQSFWNKKRYIVSTPTVAGSSVIEVWFERSDQRYFFVQCPNCGHWQILKWANVKFDAKNFNVDHVYYDCDNETCDARFQDVDIKNMVPEGHWRKTTESRGIAGFHLNQIYSPNSSINEMAEEFIRVRKNPLELKTFINTALGELWHEEQEEYDHMKLYRRREKYVAEAPQGVLYITVGADLQADRAEFEVVGWGVGEESWSLDYRRVYGNIHQQPFWDTLAEMFREQYRREDGILLDIGLVGFDQQYQSDLVKAFSLKNGTRFILPLVGVGKVGQPIATFPRTPTQEGVYRTQVGTDTAKTLIYGRYDILEPGPGYCHWPISDSYDEEFFKQATAEVRHQKYKSGTSYWVWHNPKDRRNEPLDCRQNAIAALRVAQQHFGVDLNKLAERVNKPKQTQPKQTNNWLGDIGDNWI